AIGSEREVLNEYKAPRVIDCQKRFIYPGFIDAHCHFLSYGQTLQEADLTGTKSFDEVLKRVAEHHKNFPEKEWLIGRGWNQNHWKDESANAEQVIPFPDNEILNSLYPDVPVMLTRIDGHAVLVNQKALDIVGITAFTSVIGGLVELRNGQLTGILLDN